MCEKKSEISSRVSDLKNYETRQLNDDVTMHWKILEDSKEIEVVVKVRRDQSKMTSSRFGLCLTHPFCHSKVDAYVN